MNEQKFVKYMESLNVEWGMIAGTISPILTKGMLSSSTQIGWKLWIKKDGKAKEATFTVPISELKEEDIKHFCEWWPSPNPTQLSLFGESEK